MSTDTDTTTREYYRIAVVGREGIAIERKDIAAGHSTYATLGIDRPGGEELIHLLSFIMSNYQLTRETPWLDRSSSSSSDG